MRTSTLPTLWRVLETGSRVVFGEMMPPGALEAASEAARGCELFFSIGTSSLVYTAATLPYEALGAARRSSRCIRTKRR
jgi:NAD-dependent SIR2 family protein deacetylase